MRLRNLNARFKIAKSTQKAGEAANGVVIIRFVAIFSFFKLLQVPPPAPAPLLHLRVVLFIVELLWHNLSRVVNLDQIFNFETWLRIKSSVNNFAVLNHVYVNNFATVYKNGFDTKWLPNNKGTRKRHGTARNLGNEKVVSSISGWMSSYKSKSSLMQCIDKRMQKKFDT